MATGARSDELPSNDVDEAPPATPVHSPHLIAPAEVIIAPASEPASDPASPAPANVSEKREQNKVWNEVRKRRWYQRASLRLLISIGLLIGIAALVHYPLHVTSTCVIIPNRRAFVRSTLDGVLSEILVDEGAHVKAGDVLARLDDRGLVAEREKAAAEVARLEAELTQLRVGSRKEELDEQRAVMAGRDDEVKFAQREVDRLKRMVEAGVAPAQGLTAAEHDLATKEAAFQEASAAFRLLKSGSRPEQIKAKEAAVKRATAELAFVEQKLSEMIVIRAPIDGVVVTPRFRERLHERVEPGGLVCEITDTSSVRAEIFVPENEIDTVKRDMPVIVKVESFPTLPFEGHVDFIAPTVGKSEPSRANTIRVVVNLANPDGLLKEDMHGYGEIDCGKRSLLQLATRRLIRWVRVRFLL